MAISRSHRRLGVLHPRAAVVIAVSCCAPIVACAHGGRLLTSPSDVATARPGPRAGHNLVYDPTTGRTLLLFGYTEAAPPQRSEIWAWKGDAWSVVERDGPGFRSLAGAAFETTTGRLLLFGGAGPNYRTRYGDTWTWSGAGWTEVIGAGPGPVDHHAVAYDERRRAMLVFGGNDPSGGWSRTTWTFDASGWRTVADSFASPPGRAHHAMAYDAARARVVLFGGLGVDRSYLGDTWEWDGAQWHRIDLPGPPVRARHRMAYDSKRHVVVLYGGSGVRPAGQTDGFNVLSDTWEYDGRSWRSTGGAEGPGKRMMHAMAYDASAGETLLFGGSDGAANRDDLWGWNGARWVRKGARSSRPSAPDFRPPPALRARSA